MAEQQPLAFEFKANQTFDDYFPAHNQEIIAHLKNTVLGTGEPFIFLWGESGHGKSHLLQASCHAAFQLGISSFYLDVADTNTIKDEILSGLENFALVCLDNIDHLAGRKDWELALFHFFNRHRDNHNQLILSAACAPNVLPFALADLKTRIQWGLPLKIQPLDDNDKITALRVKARQKGFEISTQSARYLLTHYDRNLASMWLMLDKLDRASLAAQRRLTIPFLKAVLAKET